MAYGDGYEIGGYEFVTSAPPTPAAPVASSTPGLRVLIDFVTNMNPASWRPNLTAFTDVSAYVRKGGVSISRGRQRPLDRNETATANVLFDDRERVFDPENDDSPFFGGIAPMRHIRIESVHPRTSTAFAMASSEVGGPDLVGGGDSLTYIAVFDGLTEEWGFDYPGQGKDATATVKCMDLFGVMSRDELTYTILAGQQAAASHIDLILNTRWYTGTIEGGDHYPGATVPGSADYQGTYIPSPERDFSYANGLNVGGDAVSSGAILSLVQIAAASEGGNLFISRDGRITYRDRFWSFRPTEGDLRFAVDAERYRDVVRKMNETLIYNDITLSGTWGEIRASDAASQEQFFYHPFTLDTILVSSVDASTRAQELLFRHREPHTFIHHLDLSNVVADWEKILSVELWDTILLEVPLPNGDVLTQRSQVEGIQINTPHKTDWGVTWWLSVPPFPNLFTDEDAYFESGVGGWTAETNCTVTTRGTGEAADDPNSPTWSTFRALEGTRSLRIDPTSDADVSALSPSVVVEPRRSYLATAKMHAPRADGTPGGAPHATHLEIDWYVGATYLSTTVGGPTSITWSGRGKLVSTAGRSPTDATAAKVRVFVEDALIVRPLYLDSATFARSA